jgi:alkyl hydroperoxide reductase subunit AhpC
MSLRLGDIAPDFSADTTLGHINFHEFIGDSWVLLFSHPADFTPVCTTELGKTALLNGEFQKRHVKPIAI